ncbi:MAG: hypothetical protein JXR61_06195 [Prolixibacteraceae bacterium]|nr:hypothetical protein [Prolixibacteraceae bacterium]
MLTFSIKKTNIVLNNDTSVKLSWRNPACNFENIPGAAALGIEIPVNDTNRMLFGNPERFEKQAAGNDREFENFEIRYGGVLLLKGTFIVQTANNKSYNGWLRGETGNLGREHNEKYIFDSISFNEEKTFINKADYDPLTDDYACPEILNPDFFKDKGEKTSITKIEYYPEFVGFVLKWRAFPPGLYKAPVTKEMNISTLVEVEDFTEAFRRTASYFVNKKNEDGTILTPFSVTHAGAEQIATKLEVAVVSPMLFLNFVLDTIFKDAGFNIENNFIGDDADLQKLIVYNNYDITDIIYYPKIVPWDNYNSWDNNIVNASGAPIENILRSVEGTFLYKNLLPQIKLNEFLLSVQNLLNVFFFFRPGNRRIVDIIDRESIFTETPVYIGKYLLGFWEMGEKKDISLKFTFEHDEEDFLFTGHNWVDIHDYRYLEKEPVNTWSELEDIENPEMDEIRYVKDQNIYVQYKLWLYEEDDNDTGDNIQTKYLGFKKLTDGFQNGIYNYNNENEIKISTKFSTLVGEQTTITYQKGNIKSERYAFESFTPRLLFYLGNNEAKNQTENLSIDWEKESNGLLNKRWVNWKRFWATKQPVSCEALFPLSALDYIINNIYKKFQADEGSFIIEEMETEFGINKIGLTKIKGYKFNYSPKFHKLTDYFEFNDVIQPDEIIDYGGLEKFYPLIGDNVVLKEN